MNRTSQLTPLPEPTEPGPHFARYQEVVPRLRRTAEKHLPGALRGVWEVDALINEALAKALGIEPIVTGGILHAFPHATTGYQ